MRLFASIRLSPKLFRLCASASLAQRQKRVSRRCHTHAQRCSSAERRGESTARAATHTRHALLSLLSLCPTRPRSLLLGTLPLSSLLCDMTEYKSSGGGRSAGGHPDLAVGIDLGTTYSCVGGQARRRAEHRGERRLRSRRARKSDSDSIPHVWRFLRVFSDACQQGGDHSERSGEIQTSQGPWQRDRRSRGGGGSDARQADEEPLTRASSQSRGLVFSRALPCFACTLSSLSSHAALLCCPYPFRRSSPVVVRATARHRVTSPSRTRRDSSERRRRTKRRVRTQGTHKEKRSAQPWHMTQSVVVACFCCRSSESDQHGVRCQTTHRTTIQRSDCAE